jgi:hypothetical protein
MIGALWTHCLRGIDNNRAEYQQKKARLSMVLALAKDSSFAVIGSTGGG